MASGKFRLSRSGSMMEPSLRVVQLVPTASRRELAALVYQIAAAVELASEGQGWSVRVPTALGVGSVHIDLSSSHEEAAAEKVIASVYSKFAEVV